MKIRSWLPSRWLQVALVLFLVVGIGLRFTHLDRKVYWHDETYTSVRIAGTRFQELRQNLYIGQPLPISDVREYLHLRADRTLLDTVRSATQDPHVTPLYYVLVYIWTHLFGDSITAIRSFSAVVSVLSLPALYWLAMELFAAPSVAAIATIFLALSPLHIAYAQEARAYSLWEFLTLVTSALLLRAVNVPRFKNWLAYSMSLAVALYTHLFSVFLAISYGAFLTLSATCQAFQNNSKFSWRRFGDRVLKDVKYFFFATVASFVLFLPWILVIFKYQRTVEAATQWLQQPIAKIQILQSWVLGNLRPFLDAGVSIFEVGGFLKLFYSVLIASLLFLIWNFLKYPQSQAKFFLASILGTLSFIFIFLNFGLNYQILTVTRYQIPCFLFTFLVVASGAIVQLRKNRFIFQFMFWIIIVLQISSAIKYSAAETWWNKENTFELVQISQYLNQQTDILILTTSDRIGNLFTLSFYLNPNTQVQIFPADDILDKSKLQRVKDIPVNNTFTFQISEKFHDRLRERYQFVPTEPQFQELWKLQLRQSQRESSRRTSQHFSD